jgi:hypothetical protein
LLNCLLEPKFLPNRPNLKHEESNLKHDESTGALILFSMQSNRLKTINYLKEALIQKLSPTIFNAAHYKNSLSKRFLQNLLFHRLLYFSKI